MSRTLRWLAVALAVLAAAPASAGATDPDWDGDGATATDCAPLDPEVHPAAVDAPDLAFEDRNCDGIDGDAAGAVFVSPGGNDLALGTRDQPVATIARAVVMAKATGRDVYAAVGSYAEQLSVVGPGFDGFGFYGGYEPGTGAWARTRATATALTGSPEGAVVKDAAGVVLQLVRLTGTVLPTDAGKSAYGLRAKKARIALEEVSVTAGPGSEGTSRRNQPRPGKPATPAPQSAQNSTCLSPGTGRDGDAPSGLFKGGRGGDGGEVISGGQPGDAGLSGAAPLGMEGGAPGSGGTAASLNGNAGSPGSAGLDGTDGDGGALGLPEADGWFGGDGATGTTGANGTGGGGGGGGAGREVGTQRAAGAGGGQGGHGGRGALSGLGGMAGGGSFGVYLWDSTLVAVSSSVIAADGGKGGAGGAGGLGGEGGDGGAGGTAASNCGVVAGNGGAGGKGGAGGSGGDGGGGAGGVSAAVVGAGGAHFASRHSMLTAGAPGAGGAGGGTAAGGATPAEHSVIGGEPAGDFDDDGHGDAADPCPLQPDAGSGCPARKAALPDQDGDGVPDSGEDADSDGVPDVSDACPDEAAGATDANRDGCPDPPPPADAVSGSLPSAQSQSTEPAPAQQSGQSQSTAPTPSSGVLSQVQVKPEQLAARVSHSASMRGKRTQFTKLLVKNLLAGATVTVTCKGSKCPRKRWSVAIQQAGSLTVAPFRKKWMPGGTRLEVAVSKPGAVSRITTFTLRAPRSPKALTQCLPPGATVRVSCT